MKTTDSLERNRSVSIVIRTLNEGRYLDELLQAIKKQTIDRMSVETLIVDSGSTDNTLQIAERHQCKIVHIQREEFSFGRSLNLGCNASLGEYFVFISGHCIPTDQNWLMALIEPFSDSSVAVTYGRQMGGSESKFSEQCLFEKYFPASGTGEHQSPYFCNNANSAFRRDAWAKFRFDESLTGLEDMHLARKLWEDGMRTVYAPSAAVYHHHHERWRQVKRRYEREAIALQKIMPEFHIHLSDFIRYFMAALWSDSRRAIGQRVFWSRCKEILFFRFCQYYGVWKGNHQHRQLSRREKEKYFYPT
ncbi:MAG: glycosyltransferase family 2 protein [Pirellulaceae bacterium]|nr:glycosyltransferase family 2 protein [Pirellulaceae bacterium]